MLKKIFSILTVAVLVGCANRPVELRTVEMHIPGNMVSHPSVYGQPPRMVMEQQIIVPADRMHRAGACEIYMRRYANCSKLATTYMEKSCQNSEMNYYQSCLYR